MSKPSSFVSNYHKCCQAQNIKPLTHLVSYGPHYLFINTTRLKEHDFWPVSSCLRRDTQLKTLCVCGAKVLQKATSEVAARNITDLILSTRDRLLKQINLTKLELCGMEFDEKQLKFLSKGLLNNQILTILSLAGSKLKDSGLFVLAPSIRTITKLSILNLAQCSLSARSIDIISEILRSLHVKRQANAWQYSLRSQTLSDDPASSIPLRRLNLCDNWIGDGGFISLVELIEDDVGIIAIDLRRCGITNASIARALEVLKVNNDLSILDLNENDISESSFQNIRSALKLKQNLDWLDPQNILDLSPKICAINNETMRATKIILQRRKKTMSVLKPKEINQKPVKILLETKKRPNYLKSGKKPLELKKELVGRNIIEKKSNLASPNLNTSAALDLTISEIMQPELENPVTSCKDLNMSLPLSVSGSELGKLDAALATLESALSRFSMILETLDENDKKA